MHKQANKMTGRSEIVNWINSRLDIKIEGLQSLGKGNIYCLLINSYYPKTISESIINMDPRNQHQYVHNLKVLQSALNKLKFKRRIQIDKLSKMKFQQNWQTISWLKKFLQQQPQKLKEKLQQSAKKTNQNSHKQTKTPLLTINIEQICRQPFIPITIDSNVIQQIPNNKIPIPSTLMENNYQILIDKIKEIISSSSQNQQKFRVLKLILSLECKVKQDKDISEQMLKVLE